MNHTKPHNFHPMIRHDCPRQDPMGKRRQAETGLWLELLEDVGPDAVPRPQGTHRGW